MLDALTRDEVYVFMRAVALWLRRQYGMPRMDDGGAVESARRKSRMPGRRRDRRGRFQAAQMRLYERGE